MIEVRYIIWLTSIFICNNIMCMSALEGNSAPPGCTDLLRLDHLCQLPFGQGIEHPWVIQPVQCLKSNAPILLTSTITYNNVNVGGGFCLLECFVLISLDHLCPPLGRRGFPDSSNQYIWLMSNAIIYQIPSKYQLGTVF